MMPDPFLFARVFKSPAADDIEFEQLTPLAGKSEWSALALICPRGTHRYAGIVSKRSAFARGQNLFTFWLNNGAVAVEADTHSRNSTLIPKLNQWSWAAAAVGVDSVNFCLGSHGSIATDTRPGLTPGSVPPTVPLRIGRLGNGFPGAIAAVFLYASKLDASTLDALCSDRANPSKIPSLVFGWVPHPDGDVDCSSRHRAKIKGTELIRVDRRRVNVPEEGGPAVGGHLQRAQALIRQFGTKIRGKLNW